MKASSASVHTNVNTELRDAESHAIDPALRSTLLRVEDAEHGWMDDFAKPMIAKRHQVDGGDATVSDLQIFYLQQNPGSWMNKTSSLLDEANRTISTALERSNASAASATSWSTALSIMGILITIMLALGIAYYTSRSITLPLNHLISVAREIGDTGDIDQTIDIHRDDEVGVLADNFNKMIAHIKGMAAVSASIAEGQLTVSVSPRSGRDTMANAFSRNDSGASRSACARSATAPLKSPTAPIKWPALPKNRPRSACRPLPRSMKSPPRCTK